MLNFKLTAVILDFLSDIRKDLNVAKKADIKIKDFSPPPVKNETTIPKSSIHVPKEASVNDQIKGVILKEIVNQAREAASKEKINQTKSDLKKESSKQFILSKSSASLKGRSLKEVKVNSKTTMLQKLNKSKQIKDTLKGTVQLKNIKKDNEIKEKAAANQIKESIKGLLKKESNSLVNQSKEMPNSLKDNLKDIDQK